MKAHSRKPQVIFTPPRKPAESKPAPRPVYRDPRGRFTKQK